jgi:hypothetical protein
VHPYRLPSPPPDPPPPPAIPPEERVLIALLIVIGAIRFLPALCTGTSLDAEPTLGLAMLVAGVWWGVRSNRDRSHPR